MVWEHSFVTLSISNTYDHLAANRHSRKSVQSSSFVHGVIHLLPEDRLIRFINLCTLFAANFPSHPAHQRRSFYREPRDPRDLEPSRCLVSLEPPSIQDSSEPSPSGSRGGFGPRIPPSRPLRQGWPAEKHWGCWACRVLGCGWARCDPQHLPDHVWDCVLQGGRALDRPVLDPDWEEERTRPAADCRWMGQVHRRLLLWRNLRGRMGLLPALCP